jgi:hypothetical protein
MIRRNVNVRYLRLEIHKVEVGVEQVEMLKGLVVNFLAANVVVSEVQNRHVRVLMMGQKDELNVEQDYLLIIKKE